MVLWFIGGFLLAVLVIAAWIFAFCLGASTAKKQAYDAMNDDVKPYIHTEVK